MNRHAIAPKPVGGPRINSGRKPSDFKKWITTLLKDKKSKARLEKILRDEPDAETDRDGKPKRADADTYLRALEYVSNYVEGKPVTIMEHTGPNGTALGVMVIPAQDIGEKGKVS